MGDWKIDKAEADMRAHEKEMMDKAVLRKKQEEDAKWGKIKESLYGGSKPDDDNIDWVIENLRKKYELPVERKIKE